jgi:predicted dienelactone hydrolase
MNMTSNFFKASSLVLGLAALSFTGLASAGPAPGGSGGQKVCDYSTGLTSISYLSARVSYPCTISGKAPATTLTGGYTNTKEDMYWLADHLSSHGFIVITMTPLNNLSLPPVWATAHKGGINKLKDENTRLLSPIRGKVDTAKLGIMGFSMGGGGTLLAAADLGSNIKTAVPLAPWLGVSIPSYRNIKAKTLVISGASDSVAFPGTIAGYYNNLPAITKGLAEVRGASHLDWFGLTSSSTQRTRFKTLTAAWLKTYLQGDTSYQTYFNGTEHQKNVNAAWYTQYKYVP